MEKERVSFSGVFFLPIDKQSKQSHHPNRTHKTYIYINLSQCNDGRDIICIPKGSFVRARRELQSRRSTHVFSPNNFWGAFGFLQTNKGGTRERGRERDADNSQIQSLRICHFSLDLEKQQTQTTPS